MSSSRTRSSESGSRVRVAAIQSTASTNVSENVDRTVEKIREAAQEGARLVCLQELFASRYFCQSEDHTQFDLAESIPGPISERLAALAKELGIVLVSSLFERRAPGLFHNTAVIFERDGSTAGVYRKMHIPDDPHYYEKFFFTPGDLGFQAFDTSVGKVGVCICWDQWYPEAARLTALRGAQFLIYPTAIGWLAEDKQEYGETQVSAWQTMMRSHAIANGVFVIAPNRVGVEDSIEFWGHSFVANPTGRMLAEADDARESTLLVDCDLDEIEFARTHWPFLRDRRIDAYGDIVKRFID
ncbi:MAG: carbon-nitrogen hydrolase [Pirellulaceae bacterium]|nr:carbon-nitrogen hydrolase [Planctomycetales bacterium]